MYKSLYALILGVSVVAPAGAADGLAALFDRQSHDFGSVPVGPLLQTTFEFKNTTQQNLHIANLRVSCGCVTPSNDGRVVAPGQTGVVHANMDSRRFVGSKSVTIFVLFDQPRTEEVRLVVNAFGRNDITLSPESVAFGQVRKGAGATSTLNLTFLNGTRVTEAACDSGYVQLAMKELPRNGGGTSYELKATLRQDIPVGKWFTDVWVKTDGGSDRIRIPVTVDVEPTLLVTPGNIQFEPTHVGAPEKKQVFVRGAQPFRILEVKGGDGVFTAAATNDEARPVHILTVQFTPGKEGDFAKTLRIVTDLKDDGQVDVKVNGKAQQ
ncbi:MAG: DUF1573 domain-containing protein [Gemmataceae bacterium]